MSATDRELLELAARAAGLRVVSSIDSCAGFCFGLWVRSPERRQKFRWNPLSTGGDALRLAANLKLHILHNDPGEDVPWVSAALSKTMLHAAEEFLNEEDRVQAICRAIVRAAAAIAAAQQTQGGSNATT